MSVSIKVKTYAVKVISREILLDYLPCLTDDLSLPIFVLKAKILREIRFNGVLFKVKVIKKASLETDWKKREWRRWPPRVRAKRATKKKDRYIYIRRLRYIFANLGTRSDSCSTHGRSTLSSSFNYSYFSCGRFEASRIPANHGFNPS